MSRIIRNFAVVLKAFKVIIAVILTPVVLILALFGALYVPPIQNWAVRQACAIASEKTGMDVSIERVLLTFPLDLSLEGVHCVERDTLSHRRTTLLDTRRAVCDIAFRPLLNKEVEVNAIELMGTTLNTTHFIPQARIKGTVGRLAIPNASRSVPPKDGSVASISLTDNAVALAEAILDDAHLDIAISDTVREDTSTTETPWDIAVRSLTITRSDVLVHLPDDTLRAGDLPHITEDHHHSPMAVWAEIPSLRATDGRFNLRDELYEVASLRAASCTVNYDDRSAGRRPHTLDANHLHFSNITLAVDSVRYAAKQLDDTPAGLAVKVRQLALQEQSGIEVKSLQADIFLDTLHVTYDGHAAYAPQQHVCQGGLPL